MTKRRVWCCYIRVSSIGGREGERFLSPDLQRQAVAGLVKGLGDEVGAEFQDLDVTGRTFERDGLTRALAWVSEDPKNRGIAVRDLSRLGRNLAGARLVFDELDRTGAALASAHERIDPSASGKFALNVFLALAELFSDQQSTRWKEAIQHRVTGGHHHGNVPIGFIAEDGHLVHDPVTAPLVVELFARYGRGDSMGSLQRWFAESRGKSISAVGIRRIIDNPVHIGNVLLNGTEYPGDHERTVSDEAWRRARLRRERDRGVHPRALGRRNPLSGLIRCYHCDAVATFGGGAGTDSAVVKCARFTHTDGLAAERKCATGFGAPRRHLVLAIVLAKVAGEVADVSRRSPDAQQLVAAQERVAALTQARDTTVQTLGALAGRLGASEISLDAYQAAAPALEQGLAAARLSLLEAQSEADRLQATVTSGEGWKSFGEAWEGMTDGERAAALKRFVAVVTIRRGAQGESLEDRVDVRLVDDVYDADQSASVVVDVR